MDQIPSKRRKDMTMRQFIMKNLNRKSVIKSSAKCVVVTRWILCAFLFVSCTACGTMSAPEDTRAAFNKETLEYALTSCDDPEKVMRYGSCMRLEKIYSMKADATYEKEIVHADGTIEKTKINNSGRPGFWESAAETVNAIAINKAMDND